MIGAKLVAHERSRTDGSTSTSDDLKGLDVSSFYLRSGRGSQQGQRRFGVHASAEDRSTGLQQTCVDGLADARQFVDKKLAETRPQRLTLAVAVDLSLVAVKHIAHNTSGRGRIA